MHTNQMYEKEERMRQTDRLLPQDLAACLWLLGLALLAGENGRRN